MDDECIADDFDALVLPSSKCPPSIVWAELVAFDEELEPDGFLLGTIAVRSVRVAVRSSDVVAAGAVRPFGDGLVVQGAYGRRLDIDRVLWSDSFSKGCHAVG